MNPAGFLAEGTAPPQSIGAITVLFWEIFLTDGYLGAQVRPADVDL